MILLDTLLVGGLRFVLDKIAAAADAELNDEAGLHEALLAAQMRVELGEMSEEAFARLEQEILERLRAIRERRPEGDEAGGRLTVAAVEATLGHDRGRPPGR